MKPKTEHRKQIEKERCEEVKRTINHYIFSKKENKWKVLTEEGPPFSFIEHIQE